jgi:hypothetical protein
MPLGWPRQVCRRAEDRLVSTQPPTTPARTPRPASRTPLAVVLLAGAGIAAAGVGGYLAQSHRQAELPAVEASPATPAPAHAQTHTSPGPDAGSSAAPVVETPKSADPLPAQPVEAPAPIDKESPRDATPTPARSVPVRAVRAERAPVQPAPAPVVSASRPPEPAPVVPAAPPAEPAPVAASAEVHQPPAPEPAAKPAPPAPKVETFVIPADAVMGLEIENSVSSETARLEDRIDARVTRDVRGDGNVVLIPAGSRVQGDVTLVEHGGKFKDRARLGIRFHTLVLADGQELPIATEPLIREGDAVGAKTSTRIGASAAGGAIIGAIFGGQKGAAIGAAAGAGAGTAATTASKRSEARLRCNLERRGHASHARASIACSHLYRRTTSTSILRA